MKISMVRRADALGRVVLPEEIRNALGIAEGTSVRLTLDGGRVTLEKETPQCALCGSTENLHGHGESAVCEACVASIGALEQL